VTSTASTETPRGGEYERVRAWVDSLGGQPSGPGEIPPGLDAPPDLLEQLRGCAGVLTRARPPAVAPVLLVAEERVAALIGLGGPELAEAVLGSPTPGTAGPPDLEALDHLEALVALDRGAAVLDEFRRGGGRRLVCELGGGWGGFAERFTRVCPNVTYLLTGPPEAFLFSAAHLLERRPGARLRLWDPEHPEAFLDGWRAADFLLAPEEAVPGLRPGRLDLVLSLGGLENLDAAARDAAVETAHRAGARYLYALTGASSAARGVRAAIERHYWLQEAPVLPASYLTLLRENPNAKFKGGRPSASIARSFAREHLVGWRRLRP